MFCRFFVRVCLDEYGGQQQHQQNQQPGYTGGYGSPRQMSQMSPYGGGQQQGGYGFAPPSTYGEDAATQLAATVVRVCVCVFLLRLNT